MSDTTPLRIAIFDFDGTLMDSQSHIIGGIRAAFRAFDRPEPSSDTIRRVIGLGLVEAMQGVDPSIGADEAARMGQAFIDHFEEERGEGRAEAEAPLFEGARNVLARLDETELLLGVATGKGRRGLDLAMDAHDIRRFFAVTQTGNDAPGKPHPGMVENCLSQTGVEARHAVVIGDTSFDMEMARNAGVPAFGVAWGYHEAEELLQAGAERVLSSFDEIEEALAALWGEGIR